MAVRKKKNRTRKALPFVKALDPKSVVREGERAVAKRRKKKSKRKK